MTTVKLAFIAVYLEVISTRICGSKAARERDFRAKNNSDVNTRLFQIRTRVWKSKICTKYLRLHFLYKENHTTVSMWMKFPRNSSFFPSHFFGGVFFFSVSVAQGLFMRQAKFKTFSTRKISTKSS